MHRDQKYFGLNMFFVPVKHVIIIFSPCKKIDWLLLPTKD